MEIPGASDVTAGKTEVAMCVGCAQTLEDGSGVGGELISGIAGHCVRRFDIRCAVSIQRRSAAVRFASENARGSGFVVGPSLLGDSGRG